ncbi:hypothetical protein AX17_007056 [Amanita inopinata Kibby_2008]|nr:hypothetical protein AX17_007056 [Amanita inopinata Kibby_2008]
MANVFMQPNISTLPRGRACANCRRRKTKCDGMQPVCGQCQRSKRPDDCEYTFGNEPTQNQLLEAKISRLEARIQELTNPSHINMSIPLHQPYQSFSETTMSQTSSSNSSVSSADVSPGSNYSLFDSTDLSRDEMLTRLSLDEFLTQASQLGFFLDLSRFRESMLLNLPLGHPSRPSPAVAMTAYVMGISVSRDQILATCENKMLTVAVQASAQTLSTAHPRRVLHGIQAELMLAYYFFVKNRLLEGQYHLTAAVSTAIASGLLKTKKSQSELWDATLPPALDRIEESERINACWMICFMDYGWAAAFDMSPNLKTRPEILRGVMDNTPPHEPGKNGLHFGRSPGDGVSRDTTEISQKAKSAFMWRSVTEIARSWRPDMTYDEVAAFSARFGSADRTLDALLASFISIEQSNGSHMARTNFLTYNIVYGAQIRLHRILMDGSEISRAKSVSAALAIFRMAISIPSYASVCIDPLMGVFWKNASQILINEASRLRSIRLSAMLPNSTSEEDEIQNLFYQALPAMINFGDASPFIQQQVRELKEAYQNYISGQLFG